MKRTELLNVIRSLVGSLNEVDRPQPKGIRSKGNDDSLLILQQVKDLYNRSDDIEVENMIQE